MINTLRNLSDAELFLLLKQGRTDAFEIIYERYFIELVNVAFKRLRSKEDAQEVVQDIFVQLYIKRTQVDNTNNLPGYLNTLLRNKIIDRFRTQLVQEKYQTQLKKTFLSTTTDIPDALLEGRQMEEKITEAIELLPEKCKEVFLLSRINQLSHQAIADSLKISVSTVEKHIVKALKSVRKQVDQYQSV